MTTNFPREPAKIYQFPARGRFAAIHQHDQLESTMTMSSHASKISFGAWYHEEAIREAEPGRKN